MPEITFECRERSAPFFHRGVGITMKAGDEFSAYVCVYIPDHARDPVEFAYHDLAITISDTMKEKLTRLATKFLKTSGQ